MAQDDAGTECWTLGGLGFYLAWPWIEFGERLCVKKRSEKAEQPFFFRQANCHVHTIVTYIYIYCHIVYKWFSCLLGSTS